jgi:hypothetical protein
VPPLFKFLSVDATTAVLTNRTLRWASPRTFNDPFDVQTQLNVDLDDDEVVSLALQYTYEGLLKGEVPVNAVGYLGKLLWEQGVWASLDDIKRDVREGMYESLARLKAGMPQFNNDVLSSLSNSKLLCLSSGKDSKLMWSHYAESHRGCVLEFSGASNVISAFNMARPVNYVTSVPKFASKEVFAGILAGYAEFDLRQTLDKFVYTKSDEWAYEKEWRIDSAAGREPQRDHEFAGFFNSDLVSVTYGLRSSQSDQVYWSTLAREINTSVKFYRADTDGLGLKFSVFEP